MKVLIDKKICTLIHIYDFLNGGYFVAHHQLRVFDDVAYNLYLNKDREGLQNLYENMKGGIPSWLLKFIEKSKGIRYFCCDGCHDAMVLGIEEQGDDLLVKFDTTGMLGCLDVGDTFTIKIKAKNKNNFEELIYDFGIFERMYCLSADVSFEGGKAYFDLGLQVFKDKTHEDRVYTFEISDIEVE